MTHGGPVGSISLVARWARPGGSRSGDSAGPAVCRDRDRGGYPDDGGQASERVLGEVPPLAAWPAVLGRAVPRAVRAGDVPQRQHGPRRPAAAHRAAGVPVLPAAGADAGVRDADLVQPGAAAVLRHRRHADRAVLVHRAEPRRLVRRDDPRHHRRRAGDRLGTAPIRASGGERQHGGRTEHGGEAERGRPDGRDAARRRLHHRPGTGPGRPQPAAPQGADLHRAARDGGHAGGRHRHAGRRGRVPGGPAVDRGDQPAGQEEPVQVPQVPEAPEAPS